MRLDEHIDTAPEKLNSAGRAGIHMEIQDR